VVKGARQGAGWNALLELALELAGVGLPRAEVA
jgi:hypothetical protein